MEVAQTPRLADWRIRHQSTIDEARYNVRVFLKDKLAVAGVVIILFTLVIAIIGPAIAPYPEQGRGDSNLVERLQAPSAKHILGTDNYGRDILSRVIYGARIPLLISFVVTFAIVIIGVPIGGVAGYYGGRLDEIVMRICDVFLAFPSLILAIVFVAFLGPSIRNAMIAIILSWWPWYTRLVRGMAVSLRERPVRRGREDDGGQGLHHHRASHPAQLVWPGHRADDARYRHRHPGGRRPQLHRARRPAAGRGVGPHDLRGRDYILDQWWIGAFAGLAILILVLAFNLVGDGLRDVLDPRSKR